jgi:hypothetical protein
MKKVTLIFILLVAVATFANAQATRTWVSGVGDDVNPCSRTAPCKTFAGAISKTASPGIINCLDPGGFGAVTITKSITIDCTGTLGSALSSGVQGVVVNTGLTTDKVVLRSIDINGAGTTLGTNGVNIIQAGSVTIDKCNIANYSGVGVKTSNSTNAINVFITNTNIINVNTQGVQALSTGTGTSSFFIDNSRITGAINGVDVAGSGNYASVSNSVIEKNTGAGFQVEQTGSTGALESTTLIGNATAVQAGVAGNTPTIRISRCIITQNTNAVGGTGTTKCFSNNVVDGNTGASNACSSIGNAQQ